MNNYTDMVTPELLALLHSVMEDPVFLNGWTWDNVRSRMEILVKELLT